MQTLQVYVEGQRLDLFSDESINVTQSIQNIKDISKIFTDFSKSFSVPASKTNNKIFKHYNNKNIVGGFDARNKKDALLEINNKPFREGKVKLEGVNLKNGITDSYKITFFGNTVNLKDVLVDYKLETLDWLDNFSTSYSANKVKELLGDGLDVSFDENVYNDAIVAPLITNTTRLFYDSDETYAAYPNALGGNLYDGAAYDATTHSGVYFEELKYAIRIHLIVKAIEQQYGLVFSEDFFNETNKEYYDLYMWLHRDKGRAFEGDSITTIVQPLTTASRSRFAFLPDKLIVFPQDFGGKLTYSLNITTSVPSTFKVSIKKDGINYKSNNIENSSQVTLTGDLVSSSTGYKLFIESEDIFTFDVSWTVNDAYNGEFFTSTATNVAMNTVRQFIITEQIPNMKIIDFLTGLFKTFNLTAYQKDGVIIIDTLDRYYNASSNVWAIDESVDTNQEIIDNAIPFSEVDFRFKGDNTFLAKKHTNITSQEWGELRYTSEDGFVDASPNVYKVEIPFEHMKFERLLDNFDKSNTTIQYGWFVDDNADTYVGEPLLFYPISNTGTDIRFLNNEVYIDANSKSTVSTYYIASNSLSLDPSVSTSNINFYLQANEYTFTIAFTGTLFDQYYKKYINNIFDIRNRLTKVTAYLPLNFLLKYQLNDKIRLRGNFYKINSITSDLITGKADLELINDYDFIETSAPNGGEGTGGEVIPPPEGDLPCPLADSTFWSVDRIDVTVDRDCSEVIPEPEPEPVPCSLRSFSASSTTSSDGLACGSSASRTLYHSGSTTYPQIGDRIHADNNCETFISDGFVKVIDENTTIQTERTAPQSYSVVIAKSSCVTDFLPTVVTNSASADNDSATLSGVVTNVGRQPYTVRGFYYILGTGSPLSGTRVEVSGTDINTFTANITGLQSGQTYSVVSFATNNVGTAYGNVVQFFTSTATSSPNVTTVSSSSVLISSAVLNGNITDIGSPNYYEKGFYWVEGSGTPTASDNIEYAGGTNSGAFSGTLTGLNYSTLHSFRAFATNSVGTSLGATLQFTTAAPSCNGGTLYFTKGALSGVNMSLSTGQLPYSNCDTAYNVDLNLFNNVTGEWTSASEVTNITVFEGSTNVSSEFTITKTLDSNGIIVINLASSTPTIFESSNRTFIINVTATPTATYQTDITVTQNVTNSSLVVTNINGDVVGQNSHTVIAGEGKPYEFYYTYTADSGYEFTGIGNIQNLIASGTNASIISYTASTIVVKISGVIVAANTSATVSWNGDAISDSATSATLLYRYGTSGTFEAIPSGGIEVNSQQTIQIQVTPNGAYYVGLGNTNAISSVTPTTVNSGAETIHTLTANTFTGSEGLLKTAFRVYPRGTVSSIASALLFYQGSQ
tara:strand:+ start:1023 stop:5117 length:4095 start_codon:yes stop_codon:yes gene_type:complete